MNPDGTLAIGMLGMNGSGLSGVAYFTPIDTVGSTLVTILLVDDGEPVTVSAEEAGEGVTTTTGANTTPS